MFIAKLVAPCPGPLALPALAAATTEPLALFEAPAGYVPTDQLATLLERSCQALVWLRLGPEDADPGGCLASLIGAVRRVRPELGAQTLAAMRNRPGPLYGWQPLFDELAGEFRAGLPSGTALVLENVHVLQHALLTLTLLGQCLLPALAGRWRCLLITEAPLPRADLPAGLSWHGAAELRLDAPQTGELAQRLDISLSLESRTRLVRLAEGGAVIIAGVLAAAARLGPDLVSDLAGQARSAPGLLRSLAQAWLVNAAPAALTRLTLNLQMGYDGPGPQDALALAADGPWTQHLREGWTQLQTPWRRPLTEVLEARGCSPQSALKAAAQRWLILNVPEQAVDAYLTAGDYAGATAALARAADELFDTGQWSLLRKWLDQLPPAALRDWPKLEALAGELAAVQGQASLAEVHYANATALFEARGDTEGAANSLLAQSALAARQGDLARAQANAAAAQALAQGRALLPQLGWSAWQLGRLAAYAGDLTQALAQLARAARSAEATRDLALRDQIHNLETLIHRQFALIQQRELHRQGYLAAERAEQEIRGNLLAHLSHPIASQVASGAAAPGPLRLPIPSPSPTTSAAPSLLEALRGWLRRVGSPAAQSSAALAIGPAAATLAEPPILAAPAVPASFAPSMEPSVEASASGPPSAASETQPEAEPAASAVLQAPTLNACLLGTFRAALDDQALEKKPASRGLALLKYLIAHHAQPTPRDVLMEMFWPNAEPKAARNRLNVALCGLRHALRSATPLSVIVFEDNAYRLNPALQVWLDVDEFERHLRLAQDCEARQRTRAAIAEYRIALELYAGDFLADDPYEDWPTLTRERLRLAHLEALDRISFIHFEQGAYAACAGACQELLARDACREDIHCRLMRCYARQGQHPLALRQYQVCVDALQAELQMPPAPATTHLMHRIRRRESV